METIETFKTILMILSKNIALIILATILSIIFILKKSISIKFDLNKFLEERNKRRIKRKRIQLQNICPHGRLVPNGDSTILESLFKLSRTSIYTCSQCDFMTCQEYTKDMSIKEFNKRQNKFLKKASELGFMVNTDTIIM